MLFCILVYSKMIMRHACGCFVFLTGAVEIDQVKNTHEIRVCPFLMPIEEENHDYFCLLFAPSEFDAI